MRFLMMSLLLAFGGLSPIQEAKLGDALILAIEYFDPEHERCIERWGEEHFFFRSALQECVESFPELAFVTIPKSYDGRPPHRRNAMTSVSLSVDPSDSKWLLETAERIGAGHSRWVLEHSSGRDEVKTTWRETTWSLDSSGDDTSSRISGWLASIGFKRMTVRELPRSGHAGLFLTSDPSDIDCVLERFHADPFYESIFGERRFKRIGPDSSTRTGSVTNIRIIPDERDADFERDFLLEFSCRFRSLAHRWVIRCRPTGERNGTNWEFKVSLESEEGDVVPPSIWFELEYWLAHLGAR